MVIDEGGDACADAASLTLQTSLFQMSSIRVNHHSFHIKDKYEVNHHFSHEDEGLFVKCSDYDWCCFFNDTFKECKTCHLHFQINQL